MSKLNYRAEIDFENEGYCFSISSYDDPFASSKGVELFKGNHGCFPKKNTEDEDKIMKVLEYLPEEEAVNVENKDSKFVRSSVPSNMLENAGLTLCDVRVSNNGLPYMCFMYENGSVTESLNFSGLLFIEVTGEFGAKLYKIDCNSFVDEICTEITEIERGYAREIKVIVPNRDRSEPYMSITEYRS